MVAVGFVNTLTEVGSEVVEHPAALVTVTVIVALEVTLIEAVVAPLDHKYVLPATTGLALNVTEPPWQKVNGPLAKIFAVGSGLTVTIVAAEVFEQPAAVVTVT
jgi:hypothetical protein